MSNAELSVARHDRRHQFNDQAAHGSDWHFDVRDGAFNGAAGNVALVFEITPITAFGFGKGDPFSQTRWRF